MSPANTPSNRPRHLVARVLLAVLGYLTVVVTAAMLAQRLPPALPREEWTRGLIGLVFVALLALALALSAQARAFCARQMRIGRERWRGVALAGAAGVLFYGAYAAGSGLDLGKIPPWRFGLAMVLLSALVIPLVEEFFFRAVAIGESTGLPAAVAALLSAVAFALIHPDRWLSVLVFALLAAAIYLRLGMVGAFAFHAAYNLANYALLFAVPALR